MKHDQIFLSNYTSFDDLGALVGTPYTTEYSYGDILQRKYGNRYNIVRTNGSRDMFESNLRGADFIIVRQGKDDLLIDFKDVWQQKNDNTISIGPKTLKVDSKYHFLGTIYQDNDSKYYAVFARTLDILPYKKPHNTRNWLYTIDIDVLKNWAKNNNVPPILLTDKEAARHELLKEKYQYIKHQCFGLTDKLTAAKIAVDSICKEHVENYHKIPEFVFVNNNGQKDIVVSPDASLYLTTDALF